MTWFKELQVQDRNFRFRHFGRNDICRTYCWFVIETHLDILFLIDLIFLSSLPPDTCHVSYSYITYFWFPVLCIWEVCYVNNAGYKYVCLTGIIVSAGNISQEEMYYKIDLGRVQLTRKCSRSEVLRYFFFEFLKTSSIFSL